MNNHLKLQIKEGIKRDIVDKLRHQDIGKFQVQTPQKGALVDWGIKANGKPKKFTDEFKMLPQGPDSYAIKFKALTNLDVSDKSLECITLIHYNIKPYANHI